MKVNKEKIIKILNEEKIDLFNRWRRIFNIEKIDLEEANLYSADLEEANLQYANLQKADLQKANLQKANLYGADLEEANLYGADLQKANLYSANLQYANLQKANLQKANLYDANLYGADLQKADLQKANLYSADLRRADLRRADLRRADLSNIKTNYNPIDFLNNNFEKTSEGYIVYKTFSEFYTKRIDWKIEKNSIIEEIGVNTNITNTCGSGINVATYNWCLNETKTQIWKCLIKFEWVCSIVIPIHTDGKIRCSKIQLLEKIKR